MRPEGLTDQEVLWAIRDTPRKILKSNLKSVLYTMVLTIGNNHKDWFYHSNKQWSEKVGCCPRVVPDLMHRLEDLEYISIQPPAYYGNGDANEYKLNYLKIIEIANYWRSR